MRDADTIAAEQLAMEMTAWGEAAKFLRSHSSLGLMECICWVRRLAVDNPDTPLGRVIRQYEEMTKFELGSRQR